jgi:hypothetical protein
MGINWKYFFGGGGGNMPQSNDTWNCRVSNSTQRSDYLRSVGIKTTELYLKTQNLIICKTMI